MPWSDDSRRLARWVLLAFLLTFIVARGLVYCIMTRDMPDLFLYMGGTHIHHLNYGIFLLAGVGGYLIFIRPTGRALMTATLIYGVGLALTFDEFGMWLHLGGGYWQRASFDAVIVVSAALALLAYAPRWSHFGARQFIATAVAVVALVVFGVLWTRAVRYAERSFGPHFERLENAGPS